MPIVDELKETLSNFPRVTPNSDELARLQSFLCAMKNAGIATTREYDIPLPDTIGRTKVESRRRWA